MEQIELTSEFEAALEIMELGIAPLFITGKAGTGKSTLLRLYLERTQRQVAVVAPTGVAALNVDGQTIHSFFKFRADVSEESVASTRLRRDQISLYRHLQTLIIDEVSMLRADLLDRIDQFLQRFGPIPHTPFGGVRMIFIGDLYQLPPVVTFRDGDRFYTEYPSPYFFDAFVMKRGLLETRELHKVYRQADTEFIGILNAVRTNQLGSRDLEILNTRYHDAEFGYDDEVIIALTSTNELADQVNHYQLQSLQTPLKSFAGKLLGTMQERDIPTKLNLELKVGAQVMLVNNDQGGRWVNGSLGKITDIDKQGERNDQVVVVELTDGPTIEVLPTTWEQYSYGYDEESKEIKPQSTGSFTQFPLRLAWAVTIHKAQGKTFDKVIIDLGRGTFAAGQLYVALSRCRSLEGIRLQQPIEPRHIRIDDRISDFLTIGFGRSN